MEKCPRCKKFNPNDSEKCQFCALDFTQPFAPRRLWWAWLLLALFIFGLIWAIAHD